MIWYQLDSSSPNIPFNGGHYKSNYSQIQTTATGGNQPHIHTATSQQTSNLPPYFALCFIMKDI